MNFEFNESRLSYIYSALKPVPAPEPIDFLVPTKRKPRSRFSKFPKKHFFLAPLFFFALFYLASLGGWYFENFPNLSVSHKDIFIDGRYELLVTGLFAHSDGGHLWSNSLLFLFFGYLLHGHFSFFVFPVVAFLVGILSNLFTVFMYPPHVHLLGASGMVYGMVALWIALYLKFEDRHNVVNKVMRVIGFSLMLLFPSHYEPNVSYLAHASGFFIGLIFGLMIGPWVKPRAIN